MFTLQAPLPSLQTAIVLPNPQFSDSENRMLVVTRKRAMDGTRYTYVKRKGETRLIWPFQLTRNKGLELRAFILAYFASTIRVEDHHGRVWTGRFLSNPFEFSTPEAARPAISPMPRGESQVIQIEFEGVEQ